VGAGELQVGGRFGDNPDSNTGGSRRVSREIKIIMRDDLDRSLDATETITLTVDDVTYIIDLCEDNAKTFHKTLKPYLEAAHEKIVPRRRNGSTTNAEQRRENQNLRKWARQNGYEISNTGQIPVEVREAYKTWQPEKRKGGDIAKGHAISDKTLRDQIRSWGRENGHEVSSHGFLSTELVRAFEDAHAMKISA
jgi:hypothetical protein